MAFLSRAKKISSRLDSNPSGTSFECNGMWFPIIAARSELMCRAAQQDSKNGVVAKNAPPKHFEMNTCKKRGRGYPERELGL